MASPNRSLSIADTSSVVFIFRSLIRLRICSLVSIDIAFAPLGLFYSLFLLLAKAQTILHYLLRLSLTYLKKQFIQLLESEKLTLEHIDSIYIFIDFDLNKTSVSKTVSNLELPSYNCNVEITDFNSKNYKASVVEWWRY